MAHNYVTKTTYQKKATNCRLFVDMDGTLATWRPAKRYEELFEKNFFLDVAPYQNVIDAINRIIDDGKITVFIISAYLKDSWYALEEKNAWLDRYLPRIGREYRLFCPTNTSKADYVLVNTGRLGKGDLLLDDYSVNLHPWNKFAAAVKLMNGVNGTNGTWTGPRVSCDTPPESIVNLLYSVLEI